MLMDPLQMDRFPSIVLESPDDDFDFNQDLRSRLAIISAALPIDSQVVLTLIMSGASHYQIAIYLNVSRPTISKHIKFIIKLCRHLNQIGYHEVKSNDPIIMCYLQNLTISRTATKLGITRRAVRWAISREKKRLLKSININDQKLLKVLNGLSGIKLNDR